MTKRAILVSLSESPTGQSLLLDDVVSDDGKTWIKSAYFTRKAIENSGLETFELPEKELADIGLVILARLHGYSKGDGY